MFYAGLDLHRVLSSWFIRSKFLCMLLTSFVILLYLYLNLNLCWIPSTYLSGSYAATSIYHCQLHPFNRFSILTCCYRATGRSEKLAIYGLEHDKIDNVNIYFSLGLILRGLMCGILFKIDNNALYRLLHNRK